MPRHGPMLGRAADRHGSCCGAPPGIDCSDYGLTKGAQRRYEDRRWRREEDMDEETPESADGIMSREAFLTLLMGRVSEDPDCQHCDAAVRPGYQPVYMNRPSETFWVHIGGYRWCNPQTPGQTTHAEPVGDGWWNEEDDE